MLSKLLQNSRTKLLALTLILHGCATAPNIFVCTELNMSKGFCTRTIEDEDVIIDDAHPYTFEEGEKPLTWWEMRPYMLLLPRQSWAEIKKFIIEVCKTGGAKCDEMVSSWDRKIKELDKRLAQ